MKKTISYMVIACMAITALLTVPIWSNQSEAQYDMIYDQNVFDYIQTVVSHAGTTTFTQADTTRNVVTTNTVVQNGSTYAVHTITTADYIAINDETVSITHNSDGMYRFVNPERHRCGIYR